MIENQKFDVIIIGGSYAGLSAAMSLGRSLRKVLVIDSGLPCNRQTPHSHNFLTQDGQKPQEIANIAISQLASYDTVKFQKGLVVDATGITNGFKVETQNGELFEAKKLVFATGLKDIMPEIKGFAECWGTSVVHCPYCHGYEIRHQKTGIIANGEAAVHYAQLIHQWTKDLILFTNGESTLTQEQSDKLEKQAISIVETSLDYLEHTNGQIKAIVLTDGTTIALEAVYSRPNSIQHCSIPQSLGCELTEQGLIKVDAFQKTNIAGIFACGDNSNLMRSVAISVASGSVTGAFVNHELISEEF